MISYISSKDVSEILRNYGAVFIGNYFNDGDCYQRWKFNEVILNTPTCEDNSMNFVIFNEIMRRHIDENYDR